MFQFLKIFKSLVDNAPCRSLQCKAAPRSQSHARPPWLGGGRGGRPRWHRDCDNGVQGSVAWIAFWPGDAWMALSWLSWMCQNGGQEKDPLGALGVSILGVGLVGAGEVIAVDSAFDSNTNFQFFEANMIPAWCFSTQTIRLVSKENTPFSSIFFVEFWCLTSTLGRLPFSLWSQGTGGRSSIIALIIRWWFFTKVYPLDRWERDRVGQLGSVPTWLVDLVGESSKVSYLIDFRPCICGSHILFQTPFVSCELKVWYQTSSIICGKLLKNNGVLRRQFPFAVNDMLGWAQHSEENPVTLTLLCGRFESSGLPLSAVCMGNLLWNVLLGWPGKHVDVGFSTSKYIATISARVTIHFWYISNGTWISASTPDL